jgi:hypothetical protein
MKSPLQDKIRDSKALRCLKKKIPKGATVHSYMFFAGNIEFKLAQVNRSVIAHTNKYAVYEFWKCVEKDAHTVSQIAQSFLPFEDENIFQLFQKSWSTQNNPFMRSALLFLLNRLTKNGTISSGEIQIDSFNPLSFSYLENLKLDPLRFVLDKEADCVDSIKNLKADPSEILLIPACTFSRGLSDRAKLRGPEESVLNHIKLQKILQDTKQKWIVLYKFHPTILDFYSEYDIIMIDQYGREVSDKNDCKELIIANF